MGVHLHKELDKIKKKLLIICSIIEKNVDMSVLSVNNRDENLAKKVIEIDDKIDLKEVELEEDCLKILALYQPVAIDLRFLVAILKINNDLERIGDLAASIAKRSIILSRRDKIEMPFDFDTMSKKTRIMLKKSIKSLIDLDLGSANKVCAMDDDVDLIHKKMYEQVQKCMEEKPEIIELLIHSLSISRNLERIADYATNIAQDIIYMSSGKIVRHQNLD